MILSRLKAARGSAIFRTLEGDVKHSRSVLMALGTYTCLSLTLRSAGLREPGAKKHAPSRKPTRVTESKSISQCKKLEAHTLHRRDPLA